MGIKYHGNYCGPGWSDGKYQSSVVGASDAVDSFDDVCRRHDAEYAREGDLAAADFDFARNTLGTGFKSSIAGIAVGVQGTFRHISGLGYVGAVGNKEMAKKKGNLRGVATQPVKQAQSKPKKEKKTKTDDFVSVAPVAIGTTMVSKKTTMKSEGTGLRLKGREFLGSLTELNASTWTLSSLFPIHPAYFVSTVLGNTCRSHQLWKCNGFSVHFVTREPTSSAGQVIMSFNHNVIDTCVNYNATDFLPRVLSIDNAVMGPLWVNHSITIKGDNQWRLVDGFANADIDDSIFGEFQAFVQSGTTGTSGYLIMDYDFSFTKTMYTLHSSIIPLPSFSVVSGVCADTSATPTSGNTWIVGPPSGVTFVQGAVYKMVLDTTRSTPATGTTLANAMQISIEGNFQNKTLADGHTFFGIATTTTSCGIHPNITSAMAGNGNYMYYRTTGSSAGQWYMSYYLVQIALANQLGVS